MAIIFDGYKLAEKKEAKLKQKVLVFKSRGIKPSIRSILFKEDQGSQLYTRLKQEAAARIGIDYQVASFSFSDEIDLIKAKIEEFNNDPTVTGIIIQKPWTKKWMEFTGRNKADFLLWWQDLASSIATKKTHGINKDIDGLHPETLASIERGNWMAEGLVLPATARAVISILKYYKDNFDEDFCYCQEKVLIIGQSDLLGKPLYWHMRTMMKCDLSKGEASSVALRPKNDDGCEIKLVGKKGFKDIIEQNKSLENFTLIISATGQENLITAELVDRGTILIDVGEPQGDIDFKACSEKAGFITPVPGGVGPMTVISLLANSLDLLKNQGF